MKENINRLKCREEILSITKNLVGIKSEVNTDGEMSGGEAHERDREPRVYTFNEMYKLLG